MVVGGGLVGCYATSRVRKKEGSERERGNKKKKRGSGLGVR